MYLPTSYVHFSTYSTCKIMGITQDSNKNGVLLREWTKYLPNKFNLFISPKWFHGDRRKNKQTDGWTNIYSIFRDKLSLPHGSSDWHSKVLIDMTSQVNINSKTKSIVIPCRYLMCRQWRWLHHFNFNPGPCTWDVSNDVCVHVPVECILLALQNPVHRIPFLSWKSVFQPVQTRLYTSFCTSWLCTSAAIFITILRENVVVCAPG